MSDTKLECCSDAAEADIYYYREKWRFDCDDGLRGTAIKHCPFCGTKIITEQTEEEATESEEALDEVEDGEKDGNAIMDATKESAMSDKKVPDQVYEVFMGDKMGDYYEGNPLIQKELDKFLEFRHPIFTPNPDREDCDNCMKYRPDHGSHFICPECGAGYELTKEWPGAYWELTSISNKCRERRMKNAR